ANYHSLTTVQDAKRHVELIRDVALDYLALGLDPSKASIFRQSDVPEVTELAWILSTVTGKGLLERATSYKDKIAKGLAPTMGLFGYPVLMAADILAYKATHVPVGEDQKQHLELSRDIAQKFNHDYGVEFFPLPEPLIFGEATRVMSLRDGTKKMSKSDPSDYSRLNLADGADAIALKIRKAKTDPHEMPAPDAFEGPDNKLGAEALAERPEAFNLIQIYAALADKAPVEIAAEFAGKSFSDFKSALTDLAVAVLGPVGEKMQRLSADPGYIDGVLREGAERARAIADPVLAEVHDIIGFLRP
ncbi:MAG: tryptophan--tRNA ligase, partial [Alphaproteobacteria bacterium]